MKENSKEQPEIAKIWDGDLLGRRQEADIIQSFIEHESATYLAQRREQSLVLAIDAQYGEGKSWFLDRLSAQLSLTHPVARIDAWADDASEEPLTAFMASIDDALMPYLTKSDKLRDKLAAAKVAALPVMGRLVKGVLIKGLSKVAGEGADQLLADAFDSAVESARHPGDTNKDGLAAAAVQGAFEEIDKEIDSLVDRRGAAMLAEYRQRRKSREGFRRNMRDLVTGIDEANAGATTPLIVIIDELDRCRPDYAIRVLEEIKHFFDVPGVVFILAIHRDQLIASIEAVYGSKFASEDYLRRFFDRRWELRKLTTAEIVTTQWSNWGNLNERFASETVIVGGENLILSGEVLISRIFDANSVTAREAQAIMDALRIFVQGWPHKVPIATLSVVPMAINLVRQRPVSLVKGSIQLPFELPSVVALDQHSHRRAPAGATNAIQDIVEFASQPIFQLARSEINRSPDRNFAFIFFQKELNDRIASGERPDNSSPSLISSYVERLERIGGLIDKVASE